MRLCVWCDLPETGAGPYWSDNQKRDSQTVLGINDVGKKVEICIGCKGPAQYYYGEDDTPSRPPKRRKKRKP